MAYKWDDKKDTIDNALTVFGKGLIDSFIEDEDNDNEDYNNEPQQIIEAPQDYKIQKYYKKTNKKPKEVIVDKRTINITNIQINGNSNSISSHSQHEIRRRNRINRRKRRNQ